MEGPNLVLRQSSSNGLDWSGNGSKLIWVGESKGGERAVLQQNGELQIVDGPATIWTTGSAGAGNPILQVENNGNLIVWNGDEFIWRSCTYDGKSPAENGCGGAQGPWASQMNSWLSWAQNPANWNSTTPTGNPGIDQDGAYGAQCADLARSWAASIGKLVGFDGNDTHANSNKPGWAKAGTSFSTAQTGDVITGFYPAGVGHVVVVVEGPHNGVITVLEQNPWSPRINNYSTGLTGSIWRP
jgi:surface antigen